MSNFQIKYTLDMVNKMSPVLNDIDKKIDRFERSSKKSFDKVDSSASALGKSIRNNLVGAFALLGGAGAVKSAVTTISDFGRAMSTLQANTGATGDELKRLRENAILVGDTSEKTATQAANAQIALARSGLSTDQIIAATKDVVNLSVVSGMALEQTATMYADAMKSMGLTSKDSAKIVDTLTAAASNSNSTVEDMGLSWRDAAPLFKKAGRDLHELAAASMVLADNGIKGTLAGTSLRAITTALSSPTTEATKVMNKLGLSVSNTSLNTNTLAESLSTIQAKLKGLTKDQQDEILIKMFGREYAARMSILLSNTDSYANKLDIVKSKVGETAKQAKIMTDNLEGDFQSMLSKIGTLYTRLGESGGEGFMRGAVQNVSKLVSGLTDAIAKKNNMIALADKARSGDVKAKEELEGIMQDRKTNKRTITDKILGRGNEQERLDEVNKKLARLELEFDIGRGGIIDKAKRNSLLMKQKLLKDTLSNQAVGKFSIPESQQSIITQNLSNSMKPQNQSISGGLGIDVKFNNAPQGMTINSQANSDVITRTNIKVNTGANTY